jgi:hypothetical protein
METKQLDFVVAFPQAPVETDLLMSIPPGFLLGNGSNDKVLEVEEQSLSTKTSRACLELVLGREFDKNGFSTKPT